MSTMDRAFIRAYADDVPPPEAHASGVQYSPSGRTRPTQAAQRSTSAVATVNAEQPTGAQPPPTAAPMEHRQVPTPHAKFNTTVETARPTRPLDYPEARLPGVERVEQPEPAGVSAARTSAVSRGHSEPASSRAPVASESLMPLSAFTSAPKPEQRFRALLEVDQFVWPKLCGELTENSAYLFDALAEELIDEAARGHKTIAVSSCRRGEGRTSLLLCVARRLASSGVKVCMVDADIHNPQLGRRLGLAAQVGWDAVVSGELALTEVLIDSLDDRLTLLPLCSQSRFDAPPSISQFSMMLSILRDHYDVVLVDMGPLLEGAQGGLHLIEQNSGIDAAVLVADMRNHAADGLRQAQRLLTAAQIHCTGIAENFVQV